jgi:hypothetical protein
MIIIEGQIQGLAPLPEARVDLLLIVSLAMESPHERSMVTIFACYSLEMVMVVEMQLTSKRRSLISESRQLIRKQWTIS